MTETPEMYTLRMPQSYLHGAVEYSRTIGIAVIGATHCRAQGCRRWDETDALLLRRKPGQPRILRFKWGCTKDGFADLKRRVR
jgi:hypothetical protein